MVNKMHENHVWCHRAAHVGHRLALASRCALQPEGLLHSSLQNLLEVVVEEISLDP